LTRRLAVRAFVLVLLIAGGVLAWRSRATPDELAVRARLDSLRKDVNSGATTGIGAALHAAQIGDYFTEDVIVELGEGSSPIKGRETLIGMIARLQPRTSEFRLELDDVTIEIAPAGNAADVLLTATFTRPKNATGEPSLDAREYTLVMAKTDGSWRIARITAIDALRQ
jgi:ketosteroid isomerase-like protein